jgi:Asp/Glu/hydantoin racemase
MKRVVGLIHATTVAIDPMMVTLHDTLPNLEVLNFLDEGLLKQFHSTGTITTDIVDRLEYLVKVAQESGAELALLTCSSFSSVSKNLERTAQIPVVAIDEAMLIEAVKIGRKIGVVATLPGAIDLTTSTLKEISIEKKVATLIKPVLVKQAFNALQSMDISLHNSLVCQEIIKLAPNSHVVVLAQVSMARALSSLPEIDVPVLSSPHFAARKIKEILQC